MLSVGTEGQSNNYERWQPILTGFKLVESSGLTCESVNLGTESKSGGRRVRP